MCACAVRASRVAAVVARLSLIGPGLLACWIEIYEVNSLFRIAARARTTNTALDTRCFFSPAPSLMEARRVAVSRPSNNVSNLAGGIGETKGDARICAKKAGVSLWRVSRENATTHCDSRRRRLSCRSAIFGPRALFVRRRQLSLSLSPAGSYWFWSLFKYSPSQVPATRRRH